MRNRAVGEFAFAAAILCSFFCWARCYASANKSDNANRRANDYRFLRLYVGVLDMCSVIFQSLSDSPTKKISESEKKTCSSSRAMHHLQCRDFYFDFMSFLSPFYYSIKKAYAFYDKLSSKMMVVAISISMLPIRPEKS